MQKVAPPSHAARFPAGVPAAVPFLILSDARLFVSVAPLGQTMSRVAPHGKDVLKFVSATRF